MARRNYSAELLKLKDQGKTVVCSVQPYEGLPMVYQPRRPRDPLPWVPAEFEGGRYEGMWRYSGRQCHAIDPTG